MTILGLSVASGSLICILSFGTAYQNGMRTELDRMGMQMMLVPLGCPFDAASRVLKGKTLDTSLPGDSLASTRKDPAVAIAAPIYTAALPRPESGRTDLWVGIDEESIKLKPWWKLSEGSKWFTSPDSVILGAEAAATELRHPGDKFYSPETGKEFTVAGTLERSGTSDDSLFFVPLATAQSMFKQPGRLTAIAIRLKDPALIGCASERLQKTPGAQVVTLTEMMGAFLNLVGSARTLILAVTFVAIGISGLTVFNTMMSSVIERTREIGIMRAIGLTRFGAFRLTALESIILALTGSLLGVLFAAVIGSLAEAIVRPYLPLAPETRLSSVRFEAVLNCGLLLTVVGIFAGLYPALRASQMQPAESLRLDGT
ncbi:MAG: ABC transporter permease [Chthonomonadales bacterium]